MFRVHVPEITQLYLVLVSKVYKPNVSLSLTERDVVRSLSSDTGTKDSK